MAPNFGSPTQVSFARFTRYAAPARTRAAGHHLDAGRGCHAGDRPLVEPLLVEEERHRTLGPEDERRLALVERLVSETQVDVQVLAVELRSPLRTEVDVALCDRDRDRPRV